MSKGKFNSETPVIHSFVDFPQEQTSQTICVKTMGFLSSSSGTWGIEVWADVLVPQFIELLMCDEEHVLHLLFRDLRRNQKPKQEISMIMNVSKHVMRDLFRYLTHLGLFGKGCCPGWQGRPPCITCLNMNNCEL